MLKLSKEGKDWGLDIKRLKDCHPNSQLHHQISEQHTYIGYKILWVIKLFLEGKRFPEGNLKPDKWRIYVCDCA